MGDEDRGREGSALPNAATRSWRTGQGGGCGIWPCRSLGPRLEQGLQRGWVRGKSLDGGSEERSRCM